MPFAWTAAFTPDAKRAVIGGGTMSRATKPAGSLRLWDLETGKEVRRFEGHTSAVRHVAVSPDGKQFLSASFDGTMRLWELATGKELKTFDGPGNHVESAAFTPEGKRAVCCYGMVRVGGVGRGVPQFSLKLFELVDGREIKQFQGHGGPILCLAVSADGLRLVSGSGDKTMRLWEMPK
jgi:WD40 repeat protein